MQTNPEEVMCLIRVSKALYEAGGKALSAMVEYDQGAAEPRFTDERKWIMAALHLADGLTIQTKEEPEADEDRISETEGQSPA